MTSLPLDAHKRRATVALALLILALPQPLMAEETPLARPVLSSPKPTKSQAGMILLPGGTYKIGPPPPRPYAADERKAVTVQAFWLDVTEVMVGEYEACVRAGKCGRVEALADWDACVLECGRAKTVSEKEACWSAQRCNPGEALSGKNHPVVWVDWNDAATYCKASGKRLPTEEEWEWAARRTEEGTWFPWGNETPSRQLCWNGLGSDRRERGFEGSCPVGSYPDGDTKQGIKDLAGNAMEWTASIDANGDRVCRGGGWMHMDAEQFEVTSRVAFVPTNRFRYLGFRCAKNP